MQQETTDDLVARFRSSLEQKDIAAREWERQAGQFKASADRLRAELEGAERRYQSAVHGRAKFREAFRKARAGGREALAWMREFAEPLINELEGYQNGDPDRTQYVNHIAKLERHAAELAQALAVCEERAQ